METFLNNFDNAQVEQVDKFAKTFSFVSEDSQIEEEKLEDDPY